MSKSNAGYSIILVLLVIAATTIVGFAGYLVFDNQKAEELTASQPEQIIENKSTDTIDPVKSTDDDADKSVRETKPGYKKYSKDGLTFAYPEDWTVNEYGQAVTNPDFKSEMDQEYGSTNIISGASISIGYPSSSTNNIHTFENYKFWIGDVYSGYDGNETIITVNNKQMIEFPSPYRHDTIKNFGFDGKTTIYFPTDSMSASVGLYYKINDKMSTEYNAIYQSVIESLSYK